MSEYFEPVKPEKQLLVKWKQDIRLTDDATTKQELLAKLEDYQSRLSSADLDYARDARYKTEVLKRLLDPNFKSVDPNTLAVELSEQDPDFDPELFDNALRVIFDYNAVRHEGLKASEKQEALHQFTLNSDETIQERLMAKRAQYEREILTHPNDKLLYYKLSILKQLLESDSKSIDADELIVTFLEAQGRDFDEKNYWSAVGVIETYNRGTTKGLVNSKGF
jgi:hypothetical protein